MLREKKALFDKWCLSNGISSLEQLQELILLEDFEACVQENVIYLNKQKVHVLTGAAVAADDFVLTHRSVFSAPRSSRKQISIGVSSEVF